MAKKKKGKRQSQKQGTVSQGKTTTTTTQGQTMAAPRGKDGGFLWWDDHIARVLRMFFAGGLGAAILNLIVWILSLGLFNVNTMVVPPGATGLEQLSPVAVLMASFIPALAAAVVYHFMSRSMGERTWGTFRIIAIVLGLLSLIPVWTMDVGTGSKVVLSLMHIVSVVGILWGFRYTLSYFPETINRWAGATN